MSATQMCRDELVIMAEAKELQARMLFLGISERSTRLARYCEEVETQISALTLRHLARNVEEALQLTAESNALRLAAKELGQ